MKSQFKSFIGRQVLTLSALLLFAHAGWAQSATYQRGPDPTVASLEDAEGPYAVGSSKITLPIGYGGGTVYYPSSTSEGPFGIVALSPGFVNTEASNSWWGPRLASHGFVVVMINTYTLFDLPGPRALQLLAALKDITKRSQASGSEYYGKVDPNRRAVMGHSMGGGGTLEAALKDPTLKAAIAMAPWDVKITNFNKNAVPTMVMAGQNDAVAPANTMANIFYGSFLPSLDSAYIEFKGGDHFFPNKIGTATYKPVLGKYAVSWLKRFVDGDTRYTPFLCGAPHQADLAAPASVISAYQENCPY